MEHVTRRDRVVADLRGPVDVVIAAWPRSRGGRRAAAIALPFLAVFLVAVLWVLGIVVLSMLGAIGIEPVDLQGSDRYVRDGALFLTTGVLTVLVLGVLASLWRSALDD
ncbi:hypothetical protein [Patulibacter sp.]|uniref:hypothetical protein n=1 Tax=Patulibacter sp. TaxID=1912859 RepID=UPI002724573C|nr:hypothetical protein [Patulibacter sp.]MDO9409657.1 hypothetical protein [Patulibacter sp.]